MKWIFGIAGLCFLILFHELGHFIAAKLFGVKVETFSIGMGPILLHKKIRGTDYRISLFPIGGYCGMKGEKDFQKAIEEKLPFIDGEADSLYGVHSIKRALIGFAGPFFNFFLAFIAYTLIVGIGYTYYTYSNKIKITDEISCKVAKNAGLITGDKIIKVNGKNTDDFSQIIENIGSRPDEDIVVTVDRDGQILDFKMHTQINKSDGTGKIGVAADSSEVLEKSTPKYGFFGTIGHGFLDTLNAVKLTIKSIGILFKGVDLNNAVSGPARVTDLLGSTIQESFASGKKEGFISILYLFSMISISLFIMNLLPIPVLDGSLILLALIEFVTHKKINPKIQYYIQFVGLAVIILLFFIGLKGDITYFINRGKN